MIKQQITHIEELLKEPEKLRRYGIEWGILYYYDKLCYTSLIDLKIREEKLMEARFFGEKVEVYVFKKEEEWIGVQREEEATEENIEVTYLLTTLSGFKRLKVKKYIAYDEDGQAYIGYVRPCFLEGGTKDGK